MMQKRNLQTTSVTLSGLSSETASAARMPVLSAQQHLAVFVDCLNSVEAGGQHVVTCLAVGERTLQKEDLVIEARLSLDAKCAWPHLAPGDYCSSPSSPSLSCLLVSGIRVGGAQEQGFSAAPCLERSNCSSDGMCRVMDLLPVAHLLDPTHAESVSGFVVELNVSHALQVRAAPAVPCCARDRTLWQELDADDTAAPSHFCTVFGLDVPLKRWAQSAWGHPSNPLPRFFSSIEGPGAYSPLRT